MIGAGAGFLPREDTRRRRRELADDVARDDRPCLARGAVRARRVTRERPQRMPPDPERTEAELFGEERPAQALCRPARGEELRVEGHLRTRRQDRVDGIDRAGRVVERERRLEEPGVEIERRLTHHRRPLLGVVDHGVGIGVVLDAQVEHRPEKEIQRGEGRHPVSPEPAHPCVEREAMERAPVERDEDHPLRSELGERLARPDDRAASFAIRRAARAEAGRGVHPNLEIRRDEERPVPLRPVRARELGVNVAGEPLAHEGVVVERQVRPVVLHRVDREEHRRPAREERPGPGMRHVEEVRHRGGATPRARSERPSSSATTGTRR